MNSDAYTPKSIAEALRIRANQDVAVCAGGTDLMVQHARGYGLPAEVDFPVLFIGNIKELRRTELSGGVMEVGAANDSPHLLPLVDELKQRHQALHDACEELSADRGYDNGKTKSSLDQGGRNHAERYS